jgi:cobalt-zinc-cadmium efflux system outer membrane protein
MKTIRFLAIVLLHAVAVCAQTDGLGQTVEPAPGGSTRVSDRTAGNGQPLQTAPAGPGSGDLVQPQTISGFQPEVVLPGTSADLTIDGLIQLGLASNPAVAQAAARVDALRGRWIQAGLPPNPTVGYVGGEIGNDGRGGQNGGFAGQEFVTGGKLRLDQAVVAQEIQRAEQQLAATQLRLTTDVRRAAYAVLVAQRRVELAENLTELSAQAVEASRDLQEAQEIPRAGLLQSELEQQNAVILSQTARNAYSSAWRQLTAVVGSDMPPQPIAGDVSQLPALLDWDEQLARLTTTSPELGAAVADIVRAQTALRRAAVEPIPNISTQFSVQYDDSTNDTIAGVQAGIPLPLWNRNQGGIRQAQAEVGQARRNAERVELDLKRRLAEAFQTYASARAQAETYATLILPKAQQTFELVQRGYRLGEIGYLDLLTAQRTYSQTNLAYLDALAALWASYVEIDGLLLSGSLVAAPQ